MMFTDENFSTEVLRSSQPVLVDFYADWCGPCRMLKPVIEELAQEYDGKAKIGSLNIEENLQTSQQYGIQALPTIYFFKNGAVADKKVGFMTKEDLKEKLDSMLS